MDIGEFRPAFNTIALAWNIHHRGHGGHREKTINRNDAEHAKEDEKEFYLSYLAFFASQRLGSSVTSVSSVVKLSAVVRAMINSPS
jgi:hypothetical protein